jgi:3-oxoacyl-[acyl-carrier protein] reductase
LQYRSGKEAAEKLAKELSDAKVYQADLSSSDDCLQLIKDVKSDFSRIDTLINNAGISSDQLITFTKPEDFDKIFNINFRSIFLLTKAVSRIMIKQKSGCIINMSSVVGHLGNPGQSLYSASKGAITSFSRSVAADLAPFGIRVNCIAPGFIESDMTRDLPEKAKNAIFERIAMQRLGKPEEVASAADFLASEGASYMTGSTIHVNGGLFMN